MSIGQQRNHVLVIEPTTTAWLYQADSTQAAKLGEIGKTFFDLLLGFEQAQAEYDIGCEDVMARHGSVRAGDVALATRRRLAVGQGEYHTVVLPPLTETLRSETMKLLEEFAAAGGQIVSCGPPPALVDGRPSDRGAKLAKNAGWQQVDAAGATTLLVPDTGPRPLRDPARGRRQGHPVPSAPATGGRRVAAVGQHQHRGAVAGHCRDAGQGRAAVGPVHRSGQRLSVRDWTTARRSSRSTSRPAAACCSSSNEAGSRAR